MNNEANLPENTMPKTTKTYTGTFPSGKTFEFKSKAKTTFTHAICREIAGEWNWISKTGGNFMAMRNKEVADRPVGYDDGYQGVWGACAVVELIFTES